MTLVAKRMVIYVHAELYLLRAMAVTVQSLPRTLRAKATNLERPVGYVIWVFIEMEEIKPCCIDFVSRRCDLLFQFMNVIVWH